MFLLCGDSNAEISFLSSYNTSLHLDDTAMTVEKMYLFIIFLLPCKKFKGGRGRPVRT